MILNFLLSYLPFIFPLITLLLTSPASAISPPPTAPLTPSIQLPSKLPCSFYEVRHRNDGGKAESTTIRVRLRINGEPSRLCTAENVQLMQSHVRIAVREMNEQAAEADKSFAIFYQPMVYRDRCALRVETTDIELVRNAMNCILGQGIMPEICVRFAVGEDLVCVSVSEG